MTAFENAWSLLKMPVVPNSLHQRNGFPSAFFDDPKTEERLLMQVRSDDNSKEGFIFKPNQEINEQGKLNYPRGLNPYRSKVLMVEHFEPKYRFEDDEGNPLEPKDWVELQPDWESRGSATSPRYRRRGYATALYDLLAYLIAREGDGTARIVPSDVQEEDGMLFWENAGKTGKAIVDDEGWGSWRVRDDL